MTPEQAFHYVDVGRWTQEGNGPYEWNCWNLLRHLSKEYFNEDLPEISLGQSEQNHKLFESKMKSGEWACITNPVHGCNVLLKSGENPHVGMYLDIDGGGVLHSLEGVGVVFTPLNALRMLGFGRVKFYKVNKP